MRGLRPSQEEYTEQHKREVPGVIGVNHSCDASYHYPRRVQGLFLDGSTDEQPDGWYRYGGTHVEDV